MLLLSTWAHSSRKVLQRPSVARGRFIPNLLRPITECDHGSQGLISVE